MTLQAEQITPIYVREKRIKLTLAPDQIPQAFREVVINVDYSEALPEGVTLPLELVIRGSSKASYRKRTFWHLQPSQIVFAPREGGPHFVYLGEPKHNHWHGVLKFDVIGELLELPQPV
jgi:hypothetical protein